MYFVLNVALSSCFESLFHLTDCRLGVEFEILTSEEQSLENSSFYLYSILMSIHETNALLDKNKESYW